MAETFESVGIVAKQGDETLANTLERLIADLQSRGKRVILDARLSALHPGIEAMKPAQLGKTCDLMIVIGGDGTLLGAGRTVAAHGTPLLGINLGRLGFMVDVLPEEMSTTLDEVFSGRYVAESRLMLRAGIARADGTTEDHAFSAINECVVRNRAFARVLDFDTYMNGDFISHHRADGMVIATPTGSTAYALSGGGPVLHPGLNALAMVPICPHTLSDRPLIVDAQHRIELRIAGSTAGEALVTGDGQVTQPLGPGDRVFVERAGHDLKLIHPPGYDYFTILRNKLQWGRAQQ